MKCAPEGGWFSRKSIVLDTTILPVTVALMYRFQTSIVLCAALTTGCSVYQARIFPSQKVERTKSGTEPVVLVAAVESVPNYGEGALAGSALDDALRAASLLRMQANSRIAIRYTLEHELKSDEYTLCVITFGILPGRKRLTSKVRFAIVDRHTGDTLLTYSYKVTVDEYVGLVTGAVIGPVDAAIESITDVMQSVSTDRDSLRVPELVVTHFMKDFGHDIRAQSLRRRLSSGAVLKTGTVLIIPFEGADGTGIEDSLETALAGGGIPVAVRKPGELRVVLDRQAFERTGLVERVAAAGRLAGASSVLVGRVEKRDGQRFLTVKLIHLARAVILWGKTVALDGPRPGSSRRFSVRDTAGEIARELLLMRGRI